MTQKKGFTLIEILVTVIVIAVLAGIGIPNFMKSMERAQALQAVQYLRTIRTSEKSYFGKWKTYVPVNNTAHVKTLWGVDAGGTKDYFFDVTTPTASTFLVRARKGGVPGNCSDANTLCIDQSGAWTGASKYKPTAAE